MHIPFIKEDTLSRNLGEELDLDKLHNFFKSLTKKDCTIQDITIQNFSQLSYSHMFIHSTVKRNR